MQLQEKNNEIASLNEQLEEAQREARGCREQMLNTEGRRGKLEDSFEDLQDAYYEQCEHADALEAENERLRR